MMKSRPFRTIALLAAILSIAALPLAARVICEYEITVYGSGGQTCDEICHFFSGTGAYQGYIRFPCQI